MIPKEQERLKALELRKQGFSYSEILAQVPVAKSSLALWLQSVGLSKKQKQRLTDKKVAASLRGALKKKELRIKLSDEIKSKARLQVGKLSKREAWLIGAALYWAEGSKEKEWRPGSRAQFGNSDPHMIRFFLFWLQDICHISRDRISFGLYIHETYKERVPSIIRFWSEKLGFPRESFKYISFKKNKIYTKRKNIGAEYQGIVRITVSASSELTRKISGWTNGIVGSVIKE